MVVGDSQVKSLKTELLRMALEESVAVYLGETSNFSS